MKTLYLQCDMGAAGDMLMAALLELLSDEAKQGFIDRMNGLGLPGVKLAFSPSTKCGIKGTRITVTVGDQEEESVDVSHNHSHSHDGNHSHNHNHGRDSIQSHDHGHNHHRHHSHGPHNHDHDHFDMHKISHIISRLDLPEEVRSDVLAVYDLIAEAESHVHGVPVDQVHFHEVGSLDAIADIVGVCLLIHEISPDHISASPIHTGSGQVRCAHGILPVPAPATAHILRGVPAYGGAVSGELCTPTGAALLRHFVSSFGNMPVMRVSSIGYGMGKKDFEAANCVRALLGERGDSGDEVVELCCNLDDMTPEAIGFAFERLMEAGALDVYTTSVGMKKNRPGILLSCMCKAEQRDSMIRLIFKHTTTLGIRGYVCRRYTLTRWEHMVETEYGPVRVKTAEGWGVSREKAEFDDVAQIAKDQHQSFINVKRSLEK